MLSEIWGSIKNRNTFERLLSREQRNLCTGENFRVQLVHLEDWTRFHEGQGHTFVATLSCMGFPFKGSGHAQVPALAIQKSISEAYERCFFHISRHFHGARSTNGFAAHPNLDTAIRNATQEAAERDAVLRHCIDERPFFQIDLKSLPHALVRKCHYRKDTSPGWYFRAERKWGTRIFGKS